MDELLHVQLIEELENAEEIFEGRDNITVRDPRNELTDIQFKSLFRVNKDLFEYIVNMLQPFMRPKLRATDLDIPLRVLVALRFYASGSYQLDIASNWFLGLSQSSVSRCIKEVSDVFNRPEIMNEWVKFPATREELVRTRRRFYEEYQFPGVIGLIDCTHVAIFPPNIDDQHYPEHVYVNRKGYHSINVQLICDADMKITNVNARFPGSTHDAYIWNNSNIQVALRNLHEAGHTDFFLLGDSGYPLRTYLLTPIIPEPIVGTPEHRYNTKHKHVRSLIERCNGVLKTRFRCLIKHRVLHYKPHVACKIINACVILHNLCIHYNIEDINDDDDHIDIFNDNDDDNDGDNYRDANERSINLELAEGRRARRKIIQQLARN